MEWPPSRRVRVSRAAITLAAVAFGFSSLACAAVYPEIVTKTNPVIEGQVLDPPPPSDIHWIRFLSARIPQTTRDGRKWDKLGGTLPDVYARLLINDKEVLRTPVQADTLEPTWKDGPRGNFLVQSSDRLRVEVWDANAVVDEPVGVKEIGYPSAESVMGGQIRVTFDGGGEVVLAYEAAHALYGLGLAFELRSESAYVTRVIAESPAARANLEKGDQILSIGGRDVKGMEADEVRSAMNAVPSGGLDLLVKHKDGTTLQVNVGEGPIYATMAEHGPIP